MYFIVTTSPKVYNIVDIESNNLPGALCLDIDSKNARQILETYFSIREGMLQLNVDRFSVHTTSRLVISSKHNPPFYVPMAVSLSIYEGVALGQKDLATYFGWSVAGDSITLLGLPEWLTYEQMKGLL